MNKKLLLVIGPEPPPATGMEIATQALVAELRRAGISYVRVDTADPLDELGNRGRWTAHNIRLALGHLFAVARRSLDRNVGAVYVPIAQEFPGLVRDIAFLLIAHAARLPVIVHLHGGAFGQFYASRTRSTRLLLRLTVGRSAVGIVLTENLRPALECVIPPDRVSVVSNGIDVPNVGRRRTGDDDTVRVLFLSSLYRWKGPLLFIEAFAQAHKAFPSLRATMAGDWPSDEIRHEALRLARDLKIQTAISFPGSVVGSVKRELFESADVFCFASLVPEGQPLVILEAMAAGLPVVAPAWPGIADTVVDGETGVLVREGSFEALADGIVYLARNADRRLRLGKAARLRYERCFTQDAFGDRMIELIRPFIERDGEPVGPSEAQRTAR